MKDTFAFAATMVLAWNTYWLAVEKEAATAVAVSHRHTQARTDSQPVLKDDLANQRRDSGNLPAIPDSSPDIGALVGASIEAAIPTIEFVDADFPCPHCRTLEKTLAGMAVNVVKTTGGEERYPAIRYAGHTWYGALSRRQIELILQQYKPPVIPQAVSVGKLSIRSHVANILSRVEPGGIIRMGSATITLPQTMQPQVRLSRESLVVTFAGQKPSFKYGQGWLAVGAPINGFTLTDSLLTVSVAGLPDVSLEVTP